MMGTRARDGYLFAYHPSVHQALQFPAGEAGAIGVDLLQKGGFLTRPTRFEQLPPGVAGGFAQTGEVGIVVGAGNGGEAGALLGMEPRRQHGSNRRKGRAEIGLSQPVGQFQAQGAYQWRWFDRVQNVPGFLFGHRRPVGQPQHHALHDVAAELHPDQLARLNGQMPWDAIGEGFAGCYPVGVDGHVGVIHGATSGDSKSLRLCACALNPLAETYRFQNAKPPHPCLKATGGGRQSRRGTTDWFGRWCVP